jgi:CRISPR-associated endonuclease/helicase Cas3
MAYEAYFQTATGFAPFPYQSAFHRRDRTHPTCTLCAPTGLGKTEAIAVDWLHGIIYNRANTPTRLVITLPMRSLTHQTAARVEKILQRLSDSEEIGKEMIRVHVLVGGTGSPPDRTWLDNIDRPCIIIGTQDQILSRQLFRGYGCSRWEWPVHGALLNNDVRIVADETQLMGVGYLTTALLQGFHESCGTYGRSELILCSATLDLRPLTVGRLKYHEYAIGPDDYAHPIASGKLMMKKALHRVQLSPTEIADKVITEHIPGTLSLVILNKVDDTIAVADSVGKKNPVLLLHSRFRGADRAALTEKLQGFTGVVVTTQVIEAGIDLDARKLFTVACPWASFVQRCGRAGRNGAYADCDVYLLDLEGMRSAAKPLPYSAGEISAFYDRADQLISAGIGDLMAVVPPPQNNGKNYLSLGQLQGLFDNHPGNSGDQVAHFIREDIDTGVKLLWRDGVADNTPIASPSELETVNLRASKAAKFLSTVNYWTWDDRTEIWISGATWGDECYVCCDRTAGGYSESLGFTGNPQHIPPVLVLAPKVNINMQWPKSQDVTLTVHSMDAREFASEICQALDGLLDSESATLAIRAAHLHDWGKAHPQFQDACRSPGKIWAKRNGGMSRYARLGFRHELASAIALLIHDVEAIFDLAYLISAHHGKCRVQIANFDFISNPIGLRGILPGDVMPAVDLGHGEIMPSVTMEAISIGEWHDQSRNVLESRGAFRLSFLETIVRVADWRASALRSRRAFLGNTVELLDR